MTTSDQKARCAYLRYLDAVLDSSFGCGVDDTAEEAALEYRALSEETAHGASGVATLASREAGLGFLG